MANSSMFVLASVAAPAASRRATAVDVYGGRYPRRIFEPAVVGMPSVQKMSLTATGIPAQGPVAGRRRLVARPEEGVRAHPCRPVEGVA